MTGLMDRILNYLAGVHNTYGVLKDLSANRALTSSSTKIPLITFNGSGCSLSSNGIKVTNGGVYTVCASIYLGDGFTANDIVHLVINVNSKEIIHEQIRLHLAGAWTTYSTDNTIVNLNAGDVVYMYAYNQSGARGNVVRSSPTRCPILTINRIA